MRRVSLRIPLPVKVMVSYLIVVALVVVPMFFYMRTIQRAELRDTLVRDVRGELEVLVEHLDASQDDHLEADVAEMLRLSGRRLTVVDPTGRVLGDSQVRDRVLENHADRPEIRAALASPDGFGTSMRHSATVGADLLYCAMRFPRSGAPRGVARLAVPVASLEATERRASTFLYRAAGIALSGAVFMSLIAALVVSRPLLRLAERAQAFAAGDFGSPAPASNDELGDMARALDGLATRLRDQLVSVGADRATLRAVIDDLPMGVILYGDDDIVIGATARVLCRLDPAKEQDLARALLERADQAAIVAEVLADGMPRSAPLELPWAHEAKRTARWIATFSTGGHRVPALIVAESALDLDAVNDGRASFAAAESKPAPRPEDVEVVSFAALLESATRGLSAHGAAAIDCVMPEIGITLADAKGRVGVAVGLVLKEALAHHDGATLHVRPEVTERAVRLSLDGAVGEQTLAETARTLRYLGGDAGTQRDGDTVVTWLSIARA